MNTIDILYGLGLILLFSLWIGVGIMGAARAKRGPCDCGICEAFPPAILPKEKPLSDRLSARDMDLELKRWEAFADRQEVNLLCQKIEEGWRP